MSDPITINPKLEEGWKDTLAEEFGAGYMKELKKKLGVTAKQQSEQKKLCKDWFALENDAMS